MVGCLLRGLKRSLLPAGRWEIAGRADTSGNFGCGAVWGDHWFSFMDLCFFFGFLRSGGGGGGGGVGCVCVCVWGGGMRPAHYSSFATGDFNPRSFRGRGSFSLAWLYTLATMATTTAICGIQDLLIETLGRWLQNSAYTLYVRIPPRDVLQGVAGRDVFVLDRVGQ